MLEKNLKKVLQEIEGGNNLGEKIHLVGATKMNDVDTINKAIELGLPIVAENRVQEFNQKHLLIKGAKQHFIGHLQTNKVKYLVGNVELIHSVDSVHLAQEIDKCALKKGVVQQILIEINIGGELSKSGVNIDNVNEIVQVVSNLKNIKIVGLMAMLPISNDEKYLSDLCSTMRNKYDEFISKGYALKYLSVGMSNDYQIAIKNGSNMIRLGRTIFGQRNYGEK